MSKPYVANSAEMAGPDGGWVEDAFDHARDLVVASPLLSGPARGG